MKSLLPLRALLVTGKGGVGKTTVTASLARFAAAQGKRVLCAEISGEPGAGSALGAALGVASLPEEPMRISDNLSAVLLTPTPGHQKFLRDVLPVRFLADAAMKSAAIRRFLSAAPTFPEMGVLYRLLDFVRQKDKLGRDLYETIVVDLPATGHALALAQIPSSMLRIVPSGPIAAAIREGLELIMDPVRTGTIIVTLPETLPVSEALELARGIGQHSIPIALLFVNRVPLDPFEDHEREIVRALIEKTGPTLGARTLERIDRARHAVARLERETKKPIVALQEVWLEGPSLAEEVASLMGQATET